MKKQINVPSIIFSRFNEDSSWKLKKFKELLDPTEGIRRGPFGSALKKELFVQNIESQKKSIMNLRNLCCYLVTLL